jgi:glucose/arabinose dehydrogenase
MEQSQTQGIQGGALSIMERHGVYEDFLSGFVRPEGKVWGRPVGLTVAKDGARLVSEDGNNTIWRVTYKK